MLALQGDGDGEVDVGEKADRGPAVPGLPADDLPGVQAGALLGKLVIFFDGLTLAFHPGCLADGRADRKRCS